MDPRTTGFPARALVAAIVLAGTLALGVVAASGRPPADRSGPAPVADGAAAAQAQGFVGEDTCLTCHDDKHLQTSSHGRSQNARTPAATGQSCESCHGPGQKHLDDPAVPTSIKRFASMSSRDVNETCLTCHAKGEHADWQGSMHDARNMSCTSCHSVHDPKSETAALRTVSASATCESCHKTEAMKLKRSGHMPVREGKMECTSCHNPHGSTNVRMLKVGNWINESCASCHTEKRGPFLWEHSAGRENCVTCHDPHGSNNDRMLVAKAPMLCQRCHVASRHPATIYDGVQATNASNRMVGRSCVNCHSQIHGSNHPAGNFFIR